MRGIRGGCCLVVLLLLGASGCKTTKPDVGADNAQAPMPTSTELALAQILPVQYDEQVAGESSVDEIQLAIPESAQPDIEPVESPAEELLPLPEPEPAEAMFMQPTLEEVVSSVRDNFPLVIQAAAARGIASGEALSAHGAFDHKLDFFQESQPLDFYENYQTIAGIKQKTLWGGEVFYGYKLGRGFFEPWFEERESNEGGEFSGGFVAPIIRDRWIDENRAKLWQAQLEQQRVEPEILAAIIHHVRNGSKFYWEWIAAGATRDITESLLDLAVQRNEGLITMVEVEEKAEIDLVDNRRIIVSRESKLIDAQRKLEQATVKLSLYYRTPDGTPLLVDLSKVPKGFFTRVLYELDPANLQLVPDDELIAQAQRPELQELRIMRQQLNIALRQAKNETQPNFDGGVKLAQDIGGATSSLRDKSEFELEIRLTVDVPLERRKAYGKIRSLRGKIAQLTSKNQFTFDKITADVRIARAALEAAQGRVARATESFELAIRMQEAEQELFRQGQSTLLNLNIREKQSAEAAAARIQAQLEYQIARADYAAALGSPDSAF